MKKTTFLLFCALFLHFSASAMCYNVLLQEAIVRSPVIVYAEVSFDATTNIVRETTAHIKVIENIKGEFSSNNTPVNWYFPGSNAQRIVKKETIKGVFFLSKNAKNEWEIDGIGCYNHRMLVDDNNKIILSENEDATHLWNLKIKRVTMSDFKTGVALYLKSAQKKGVFKKNKKTKNETYKALTANFS